MISTAAAWGILGPTVAQPLLHRAEPYLPDHRRFLPMVTLLIGIAMVWSVVPAIGVYVAENRASPYSRKKHALTTLFLVAAVALGSALTWLAYRI